MEVLENRNEQTVKRYNNQEKKLNKFAEKKNENHLRKEIRNFYKD